MDSLATSATPRPAPPPAVGSGPRKFAKLLLNGTACYLLAYQLVQLVYQAGTVAAARRAHVPGAWGPGGPRFELPDSGWHLAQVLDVYSAGPALTLLLSGASSLLFWRRRLRPGLPKLLLLWVALHATNAVLGGLLADTVTQSGAWYVPNWLLGVGTWPSMVLGLLLSALQVALGFGAAVPFLLAQDSHSILEFERRSQLVRYTLAGPWLLGSFLLLISKLPFTTPNESLRCATMGLLLVPLAIGCQQEFFSKRLLLPRPTQVAWGLVGLALLGLLAWRLALNTPLAF